MGRTRGFFELGVAGRGSKIQKIVLTLIHCGNKEVVGSDEIFFEFVVII